MPAGSHELGDDSAEHQDQSPTEKKGARKPKRNAKQQQQNKVRACSAWLAQCATARKLDLTHAARCRPRSSDTGEWAAVCCCGCALRHRHQLSRAWLQGEAKAALQRHGARDRRPECPAEGHGRYQRPEQHAPGTFLLQPVLHNAVHHMHKGCGADARCLRLRRITPRCCSP